MNANFEDWRKANPTEPAENFQMNFNKISNTGGALFDFVKMHSISKDVIARMTAEEVYDAVLKWANDYNKTLAEKLSANRDYVTAILNIERGIGAKSRKDLVKWEDVENELTFFFDDTFVAHPELLDKFDDADVKKVAAEFAAIYDENDDKDTWFGKIKQVAGENGFATDMKAYKANPSDYKGSVADVAKILRVLVTGREQTPDLYAIMKILGKDKTLQRLG